MKKSYGEATFQLMDCRGSTDYHHQLPDTRNKMFPDDSSSYQLSPTSPNIFLLRPKTWMNRASHYRFILEILGLRISEYNKITLLYLKITMDYYTRTVARTDTNYLSPYLYQLNLFRQRIPNYVFNFFLKCFHDIKPTSMQGKFFKYIYHFSLKKKWLLNYQQKAPK